MRLRDSYTNGVLQAVVVVTHIKIINLILTKIP